MHGKGILFACAEKIAPIKTFWKGGHRFWKRKKNVVINFLKCNFSALRTTNEIGFS